MSEPEVKFEIDEHGRIGYRVTNEGVLLSKDEKEFIIDHIARMQEENAKLRKLLLDVWDDAMQFYGFWDYVHDDGEIYNEDELPRYQERMRELGIEVE